MRPWHRATLLATLSAAAAAAPAPAPRYAVAASIPGPDGGWDYARVDSAAAGGESEMRGVFAGSGVSAR